MNFRKLASIRWMALILVVVSPALARAQALADRVPADTIVYVGWTGVEKPGPGFDGSHLQAVLNDSNLPQVFDEFIPKVLDRISNEDKDVAKGIGIFRAVAGPMWRHPSAFAFVGGELGGNGPMPKLLMLSQAGAESAQLKAQVEELLKQAGQTPFPVSVVQVDDIIAVVVGYDKPESAVIAAGGKSLAADPNFTKALSQVGKNPLIAGYVDMTGMLKLVDMGMDLAAPDIKANWEKARDQLGLKSVQRIIWTAGFDGKDWGTQAFVAAPLPRTGLVASLFEADPFAEELLHAIPKNVTVAGGFQLDLNGIVTAARMAVASFDPDSSKEVDAVFQQINQTLGMDVQKDVLATFGNQWVYYLDPNVAGQGPVGATVVNHLKDPAKAEDSLNKIEQDINKFVDSMIKAEHLPISVSVRQAKVGGVTVHYLGLPMFAPAWAIQDGNLYVALYPEVVAAAANQVAKKGETILDNPDAMVLWHRFGERPATAFSWVDLPRLAPQTYGSWLAISHLSGAGDLFGVPAPLMILPPLNSLLANLSPAGEMTWTDDEGMHFRGIEPFPGSTMFASDPMSGTAAEIPAMVGVLLPALKQARENAEKEKAAANLDRIGKEMLKSSNGFSKEFPRTYTEQKLPTTQK